MKRSDIHWRKSLLDVKGRLDDNSNQPPLPILRQAMYHHMNPPPRYPMCGVVGRGTCMSMDASWKLLVACTYKPNIAQMFVASIEGLKSLQKCEVLGKPGVLGLSIVCLLIPDLWRWVCWPPVHACCGKFEHRGSRCTGRVICPKKLVQEDKLWTPPQ
mgnify:CR=1 FL=1